MGKEFFVPAGTLVAVKLLKSAGKIASNAIFSRGSGGKNVIFSNGPNSTSECSKLLY